MKRIAIGIAMAGALATGMVAFTGVPLANAASSTHKMQIRLALVDGTTGTDDEGNPRLIQGEPCYGADGNGDSDISAGASATVTNAKGTIIGNATLGNGKPSSGVCLFSFSIKVPTTSFYRLEIGSGHGSTRYSLAQLKRYNWRPPELSLGG